MTNPKHTDTSRSGDLVERLRGMDTYGYQSQLAWEAADRIEALEAEVERLNAMLTSAMYEAKAMMDEIKRLGGGMRVSLRDLP